MRAMDPALWELLEGNADDEIKSIIRLRESGEVPPGVRVIARFGNIATVRLPRSAILDTRADEAVASLKAPRLLTPEPRVDAPDGLDADRRRSDARRPPDLPETGRGVIVGVIDWGCDFAHPNFCNADGSTRLLALWDQRGASPPEQPNRYGYGVVHSAAAINRALLADDPYAALDYHPADGDPDNSGAHGTHVMDIAAGNGRAGGPSGIAPEADLIFVHLATEGTGGLATLGDSVTLLEAVDFIANLAGERPWVINCSMGRHGGPHDGSTLVEQGLDAVVSDAPGRAIIQSTGNYFDRKIHASGQLRPGEQRPLIWQIDAADLTPNELEVWYSGRDTLLIEIRAPDGRVAQQVALGESAELVIDGQEIGRIYHRAHDPNNLNHHIDAFLDPNAPPGDWEVTLTGTDVVDGRYHAWVERDAACRHCQSRFDQADINPAYTTGTICNGFRTIAVGAYDARAPDRPLARFSSAGPTVDGRQKPNLVAPGVAILAARSASRALGADTPLHTRKSGTSMAAPHVTGTVACMFEAAGRPLWIHETQSLLLGSTDKHGLSRKRAVRLGSGYLNIAAAVAAARRADARRYTEAAMHQQHDAQRWAAHESDDAERAKKRNFILISGGPGLYDDRDVEHDKSWANYVTPPLLLTDTTAKRASFVESDEEVWWFIYKPAYVDRWNDDVAKKRSAAKVVKDKGFSSYVDLLEARAKSRGWKLRWLSSADDLWAKLKTFNDPISRVWYWGHARADLWLTLAHSSASVAVAPDAAAIITTSSITSNSSLKKRFQAGNSARVHRFVGCNTASFAQTWAATFGVWAEGFEGKVDFSAIHSTGGEPSLVGSAQSKRFSSSGTAENVEALPWLDEVLREDNELGWHADEEQSDGPLSDEDVVLPHLRIVERADAAVAGDELPAGALLAHLLPEASAARVPSPAALFEALVGQGGPAHQRLAAAFEVVAGPGDPLPAQLQPGDLLVRRGDGGMAHLAVLADGRLIRAPDLRAAGLQPEARTPGTYAQVVEAGPFPHTLADGFARRLARNGHLDRENLVLRLREATVHDSVLAPCHDCQNEAESLGATHTCLPGEGPPAAVPDPEGKGLHPLVYRGSTKQRSRNPTVGHAQQCLNRFLQQVDASLDICPVKTVEARQFITSNLAKLKADGQFPLAVDCRFGPSTERATKMFQACVGLDRDGKIGQNTWRELDRFCRAETITFSVLLDADRDGSVDGSAANGAWQWGRGKRGAVVLVNNDDDGINGKPDNEDSAVDASSDVSELAPLVIQRSGPASVPAGWKLELLASNANHIRVFDSRTGSGSEIIGPSKGTSHTFANLNPTRIELGMEALRYAGAGFDGEITLTLRATDPAGTQTEHKAVVRVAPWMIASHLAPAKTVFVMDAGSFNSRFRTELKTLVTAAGCTLSEFSAAHNDIWMQDCMEIGFSNTPSKGIHAVMRAPRDRELKTFPKSLLNDDVGYHEPGSLSIFTTFDSTGNLEATPPVTSKAGKQYPFGRVYFCPGVPAEPFDDDVRQFLRKQTVQDPIEVDTTWLTVGHVDEVISFVPAPGAKGFKMLLASPRRAYAILDGLKAKHGSAKLLVGRTFPVFDPLTDAFLGRQSVETTISAFLSAKVDFHPEAPLACTALGLPCTQTLRDYNTDRQANIDTIRAQMKTELGLAESDIIDIPAIFMPNPRTPPLADALTAGMVNMLVVNSHCIVPKPFGPVVGGKDIFEEDVASKLGPLGLTVKFLDCWDEYHVNLGEIHCGTNTLRTTNLVKWWEFQP